ncbi:MAG: GNAT family N-acetyltransferase [Lacrimispora sp.]
MDYLIKALTPELGDAFVEYIGEVDFDYAPHWATCYCRYYYSDSPQKEWMETPGDKNREEALQKIKDGSMRGYLAFDGDKCVGWCSANDARSFVRLEKDIEHLTKDKKVGCVICFIIHPEYRGKGIARQLLRQAVKDFKSQGFQAVLALPFELKETPQKQYRGTLNMYREQGFQEIEKHDSISVMWLELSETS